MITSEENRLLIMVQDACENNPKLVPYVVTSATNGLVEAEQEQRRRASDMETVAVASIAMLKDSRVLPSVKKQMSELVLSKIGEYLPKKVSYRWDDTIREIK